VLKKISLGSDSEQIVIFPNHGSPGIEEMRAELAAVLSSRYFSRAPTLVKFLSYICEKHFQGETSQIKEYTVAVEAFGRPESFEPKQDPIVRVDANRLRLRLMKYYRNEGRDHPIQIHLPKGQYIPVFEVRDARQRPGNGPQIVPRRKGAGNLPVAAYAPYPVLATSAGILRDGGERKPNPYTVQWRALLFSVACVLLVAFILMILNDRLPGLPSSQAQEPSRSEMSGPGAVTPEIRILCGNYVERYMDQVGRVWGGDRFFDGGKEFRTSHPVIRAEDQTIWQNARVGEFSYRIPLDPGVYQLNLYFSEPTYGADPLEGGGETTRLFDVFINDEKVLAMFDIVADAGGARTADIKVFTDVSPRDDGFLQIRFMSRRSQPLLNGIELFPGIPGRMQPLRITTSNVPVFSEGQGLWGADRFFWGGRRFSHLVQIQQTENPELYGSERFGNFSYCIPVAPGRYTARLHFSEGYFGPEHPGHGGKGSRVFDVYCNGLILLKDLDIFTEAGGPARALVKEFKGLRSNAQGKLLFNFQPVENYACVNALEIIQEAGEGR
jgi:hypothetical protein